MKKGLYLYCVRKRNTSPVKAVKTIGQGGVCTLPFEELEAVVSGVDLEKFSSGEIQKKAQEDLSWIKEKAQVHEHVIERAMEVGGPPTPRLRRVKKIIPVLPMKFGTIFKSKQGLEEMLRKNSLQFRKALEKLEGKQEWGIKVYLDEEIFEKQLKKSEVVLKKEREIASLPKGTDFFARKRIDEVIKKEKDEELGKVIEEVFEDLEKLAAKASQGKNLDKAITGREEPMVLNANFLIKEEKVGEFQKEVGELKTKYEDLGLVIQESGPWPPYNFVS